MIILRNSQGCNLRYLRLRAQRDVPFLLTLLRFSPMVASTSGYYRAFNAPSSRERRALALGSRAPTS